MYNPATSLGATQEEVAGSMMDDSMDESELIQWCMEDEAAGAQFCAYDDDDDEEYEYESMNAASSTRDDQTSSSNFAQFSSPFGRELYADSAETMYSGTITSPNSPEKFSDLVLQTVIYVQNLMRNLS